jgi:hypothetical protein
LAKAAGQPDASGHAERVVGKELGIAAGTLHKICSEIRAKRQEWDGAANFPAITLAQYQKWMLAGEWPWGE